MHEIRRHTDHIVDQDCIFCKIVKGDVPCTRIYENKRVLAFADINPVSEGHTLLIPKVHAENLWLMPDEDLAAIHLASKKVLSAITAALNPTGVAVLQLNGHGANQEVNHYHVHLIPRQKNGPPLPMTMWDLKPGNMARIKEISGRISAEIQ